MTSADISTNQVKKYSKRDRILLGCGVAFLIFDMIMSIDWFIVGSLIAFIVFFILCIGTLRKQNFIIRFSKITILVGILFIFTNPLPTYWIPQFSRRWMDNRTQLLEPDHPIMNDLNESFQIWFSERNGISFKNDPVFENRVREVDIYIRTVRFQYTLDQVQYYGSYDYLPTLDEILASEDTNGKWHDDCDGISLMTASFLLYLGFQHTYISEVTYHYHTMVFQDGDDPKTAEGYLNGISLYQGRVLNVSNGLSDKVSYYLFNQTDLFIPATRPLVQSIFEILTDGNVYRFDITEVFNGILTGLPPILNYIIILIGSIVLAKFISLYCRWGILSKTKLQIFQRQNKTKKTWGISIILGIFIYLSLVVSNAIAIASLNNFFEMTFLCNPLLIIVFIAVILVANHQFNNFI